MYYFIVPDVQKFKMGQCSGFSPVVSIGKHLLFLLAETASLCAY